MATTIKLKNSVTTTNTPTSLAQGEVAINITDKKVWVGNAATTPVQLLGDGGSATFSSITVTGVSTFSAGTVSAPSITTSGDTNTGIFFPAADTIAFTEGGVESMRIDSSGNVGIGITNQDTKLGVDGRIALSNDLVFGGSATNATRKAILTYNAGGDNGSLVLSADPANSLSSSFMRFDVDATERMRIDSSGNVLVGTTSSSYYKSNFVVNSASSTGISIIDTSSTLAMIAFGYTTGTTIGGGSNRGKFWYDLSNDSFNWNTAGTGSLTPNMRITSGGEVYIAGTTDQGAYNLQCNGTGVWGAGAYVNGSDARIKEDIAPIQSGLDVVEKLNPVTYRYKEEWSKDQSTQTGFIAQELLTALDGQVYVDGVVQQGGEYMSVAYQNIIPILTKAIQEQQQIINDLKARIETLESK
jgi:hypothetical protein